MAITPRPPPQGAPDLMVGSASVSDHGPVVGASFTVSATVSNTGDGASPATTLRYYRSVDTTITTSDTEVGTVALAGLPPSGSGSGSVDLTAPSSPGTYYYGACVDAVTDESDTTNNCSASVQVAVLDARQPSPGAPDLMVGSASVSDHGPDVGASFTVSATVSNTGDGASPATTLRYYRSVDTTITTSDTEVGTVALAGLPPSGSGSGSVDLTAPSSPGTYYYGACVDAVTDESDTANNCSASVQVAVLDARQPSPGAPDLMVGSASVSDHGPDVGASFTVSATVSNTGDGASPATTLRYYRSVNTTITRSDTEVGAVTVAGLSPSGSGSGSVDLTAPSSPGTYYYGACVDAVADESDTANNCSASVPIDVSTSLGQPTDDRDGTRAGAVDLGDITENSLPLVQNRRIELIGDPGDIVDYFRFALTAEKHVRLALTPVHGAVTPDLFLEDDIGRVLRQKTTTGVETLEFRETLQAGTYYIRIADDAGILKVYILFYAVSR